jgi:hypothetical protein
MNVNGDAWPKNVLAIFECTCAELKKTVSRVATVTREQGEESVEIGMDGVEGG